MSAPDLFRLDNRVAFISGAAGHLGRAMSRALAEAGAHVILNGPAKAALLQLTRHLAVELGPEQIRVNALVPGPFPRDEVAQRDPEFASRLAARTMLGRTAKADEIRGPLLFLAPPASSSVTGVALALDGGWTAW